MFAVRIGVSIATLRRMESGDPAVQLGSWARALEILESSAGIDSLLQPEEDLFARYEQQALPVRQRAPRRRSRKT
jgi:hypothetical protein